ncbi:sulfurtransferase TusA family protein [Orenia marismortui]|uniref:sulfurtransferase TusA family protein n=1 Tax=Orenia marismortui TaxID=46469 RepID=UPI00036AD235|nr:sulfurtransferase TusA family protein [Orenia marismortui]
MNRLDCIGEPCPLPLMKAEKKIKKLKIGEKLYIEVDHTCAMTNVPEWARKRGYNVEIEEVTFGEWQITVTKTK